MTKIILATRAFREEFYQQIKTIAPDYQIVVDNGQTSFEWDQVAVTIGWKHAWEKDLLTKDSHLAWVQSISAGVDTLPLDAFAQQHVLVSNGSGIHAQSITDHLLALLFMENRGIFDAIHLQQQQKWAPDAIPYAKLADKRILIVGTGQIGQQLAKSLMFFGVQPNGINTSGHAVEGFTETYPLADLFPQASKADYVINILPLTDETTHLYNQDFFDQLKSTASFYNVGRGPSVDTKALAAALKAKQFAFAALDVFEEEPLPSDDPLWSVENLLITPHISGHTPHFQNAFMEIFLTNLNSFVNDGTLNKNNIDLSKGY
ncbi:hypothetical protein A5886_002045 [Enterococcus sp. 8G7_MSG3316]|uniref:D-isomer specific 2-hydroxyacid dehydrogenase NAD-binding domain-containing protein n=1 Tax=Candidatus Enterococcus testudinis TaxID=1834191 RepID=A0A242A7F1_9ENTE|nr:NAD(P)-dependent oxidoreductase [Enterococcus sp. 8G7_MSG3316]OTN76966.1 hypothetical protein A5886_002045 [Enterococcus sp. 8G7_MSG3316]